MHAVCEWQAEGRQCQNKSHCCLLFYAKMLRWISSTAVSVYTIYRLSPLFIFYIQTRFIRLAQVTHPVCGCRLFQVSQRGTGEEGDQPGWSPRLRLDPAARQRRDQRLRRQELAYGQGWLSRKHTPTFINMEKCAQICIFYSILWLKNRLLTSFFGTYVEYSVHSYLVYSIFSCFCTWGRQVTMEENATTRWAVQFLTQQQAPYCTHRYKHTHTKLQWAQGDQSNMIDIFQDEVTTHLITVKQKQKITIRRM